MIKHKYDCSRIFKNYDKTCPRCIELIAGAEPRSSWHTAYFKRKREEEARFVKALKNHNCAEAGCMPICTFGDW